MARMLSGSVSALALTFAGCLYGTQALAAAAPAAPAADVPAASVSEVVVTAEKRAENLETTPVAVTAFTARERDLMGIESVQDLSDYTPGLSYSTFDNRPYIRGIGRQTDNLAVESGVAVYSDGIYYGANASTILQLDTLFVERIDVLRGPQSTLYGRNADGGAINYISRKPTHEFYAEGRAGYANYDKWFVEALMSGPINDHLRMLIGGNYTQQTGAGYYTNLTGSPEGGSVAQGGNGTSYHAEIQFEGDLGPKFDWWFKAATNDYDVSYHTEQLSGPLDTREFYDPLMPNQNYGLCLLPGSSVNPGCAPGQNPDTLVSATYLPGTVGYNPSDINPRDFQADFFSRSRERDNAIFNFTATWHGPGFDVKYLTGFQSFKYYLNAPWLFSQGVSSSVESYVLQGPPGAGNLTIYPSQTQFTFVENESFFSHEVDFQSTGNGPVQWLAGLYWYHENYDQPINVLDPNQPQVGSPVLFSPFLSPAAPNPSRSVYNEDTRLVENSLAAFTQVDWNITPTLKLTGGVRYSADSKYGEEAFRLVLFDFEEAGLGVNTFGAATPAFDATSCTAANAAPHPGAGLCTIDTATGMAMRHLDAHWQAWTGTVNLGWTPDADTLAYARYSRGYKTGGFNSGIVAPSPMTLPETVDAFEVGFKRTFFQNFQTNIAAFYYNYANDQQPLGVNVSGVVTGEIINLPTVHTYGVELENIWKPIRNVTLGLDYAYLHARIGNMNGLCVQDTADPLALAPGANTSGCTAAGAGFQNLQGQTVPESPENKVTVDAAYSYPTPAGTFTLTGVYVWRDVTYNSPFNRYYNEVPAFGQVNLRLTFNDIKNRYTIIAFCNNVANSYGYDAVGGIAVTNPGPSQIIDRLYSYTAPRTYGIEVQVRWP